MRVRSHDTAQWQRAQLPARRATMRVSNQHTYTVRILTFNVGVSELHKLANASS